MSVIEKLANLFDVCERSQGMKYFKSGDINLITCEEGVIIAEVYARRTHQVQVANELENQLLVDCSCPSYTIEKTPCRHIWATILMAESRGWKPSLLGGKGRIRLEDLSGCECDEFDSLSCFDGLDDLFDDSGCYELDSDSAHWTD